MEECFFLYHTAFHQLHSEVKSILFAFVLAFFIVFLQSFILNASEAYYIYKTFTCVFDMNMGF